VNLQGKRSIGPSHATNKAPCRVGPLIVWLRNTDRNRNYLRWSYLRAPAPQCPCRVAAPSGGLYFSWLVHLCTFARRQNPCYAGTAT
jgi:hypothetical protein